MHQANPHRFKVHPQDPQQTLHQTGLFLSRLLNHHPNINIWQSTTTKETHYLTQDSFPNYLDKAENSLACMSSSNLLTELFNITPPSATPPWWDVVHPITFPSQYCQTSRTACEQCQLINPCLSDNGSFVIFPCRCVLMFVCAHVCACSKEFGSMQLH